MAEPKSENDQLVRLENYQFDCPDELIAQHPIEPRDASRLMVVDRSTGNWTHRKFRDLPEFLDQNDVIVANNTRVFKARLLGKRVLTDEATHRTTGSGTLTLSLATGRMLGGKVEFLLLREIGPQLWEGAFHASVKHRPGVQFEIPISENRCLSGTLVHGASESEHGLVVVRFDQDPLTSGAGEIPLPPYIERSANIRDEETYQTVFSKTLGSAAAPTAGLHFTQDVLREIQSKDISWKEITLNVGLGTFRPVKALDVRDHVMHEEKYEISTSVATELTEAKRQGKRVLAVGTTSVRTLESAWDPVLGLKSGEGQTSLFIRPGAYQFKVVDRLLTNFHLSQSSLLLLVSAFAGRELILAAYQDAVKERYRFFSYGDAMLIL